MPSFNPHKRMSSGPFPLVPGKAVAFHEQSSAPVRLMKKAVIIGSGARAEATAKALTLVGRWHVLVLPELPSPGGGRRQPRFASCVEGRLAPCTEQEGMGQLLENLNSLRPVLRFADAAGEGLWEELLALRGEWDFWGGVVYAGGAGRIENLRARFSAARLNLGSSGQHRSLVLPIRLPELLVTLEDVAWEYVSRAGWGQMVREWPHLRLLDLLDRLDPCPTLDTMGEVIECALEVDPLIFPHPTDRLLASWRADVAEGGSRSCADLTGLVDTLKSILGDQLGQTSLGVE